MWIYQLIIMKLKKLKKTVLFICKHNSARSQIAKGLLKELYGQYYNVFSAGTDPSTVSPYAIKVMADRGIDISKNYSKSIKQFKDQEFDYVVTVCNEEMMVVLFSLEVKLISTSLSQILLHLLEIEIKKLNISH